MREIVQVITTTNSKELAEKIAKNLLEKKLAGCVQIVSPVRSLYWWQGKIEEDNEVIIFIKTRKELYQELEAEIKNCHNYTVPEILCFPVIEGNPDYLEWLNSVTKHIVNENQ
ncbi:MAG: divalent-cation tolerance protein CutA [candidate division WOR-3 bacterium]